MRRAALVHRHGKVTSRQLSAKTWPDFERLFASNGGVWGGCWCMFYHSPGKFEAGAYDDNREAKRALTREGRAHGTLVYCGKEPVGWCQFGPKEELPRIDRKRGYTPVTDNPWRITCLFVAPGHRRSGIARFAVVESLKAMWEKAGTIEAYPAEGERSPTLLWAGTPRMYEDLGFTRIRPLGKGSWIYAIKQTPRPT